MKVSPTITGIRVQASTATENAIVTAMVRMMAETCAVSDEEAGRHSVQCEPSATWRNWVELPTRFYVDQK